jgi:hypothetical protein
MIDLIVLVADKNMEFLFKGLLPRLPIIENVNEFTFEIYVHPHRDPGIRTSSDEFLSSFRDKFRYALIVLDHEGSGEEDLDRTLLEDFIYQSTLKVGWDDRTCVIAVSPEIENWIWVNSNRVHSAIGWTDPVDIYDWLVENGMKLPDLVKPTRPKEAFEAALRFCRTPRSSALYEDIAKSSSYRKCQDPSFIKMIEFIREKFKKQ